MKKASVWTVLLAALIYLALYPLAASAGVIHPACYAYVGTVLPLLMGFVYLYVASRMQCFGAATVLNGFVLIIGLLVGEGNPAFIIGFIVLTVLAEIIRKANGYDTLKGVRFSFIPFAYSFYAYAAHWWTDTQGSLAAAVEEMPSGYADKMLPVINNIPVLIIALVLVIPVALLSMKLAEKIMKKSAALLK